MGAWCSEERREIKDTVFTQIEGEVPHSHNHQEEQKALSWIQVPAWGRWQLTSGFGPRLMPETAAEPLPALGQNSSFGRRLGHVTMGECRGEQWVAVGGLQPIPCACLIPCSSLQSFPPSLAPLHSAAPYPLTFCSSSGHFSPDLTGSSPCFSLAGVVWGQAMTIATADCPRKKVL